MSKVQMLRVLVNQRLTAAAEEIFELFERTIAEYEEELCRSKENHGQDKVLDAVFNPEVRLQRADIEQMLVNKEEVPPEQQAWSPSLDQENPPDRPLIKEEQEALWANQEGEQLQGLEEAEPTGHITKFTFTPVPMKSEEEKPQSSQLHQSQTEESRYAEGLKRGAHREDGGGSEPDRNINPVCHLQPVTHEETSLSKTDNFICDWEETSEPQSGLNPLQNKEEPVGDVKCNTRKTSNSSSECAASVGHKEHLQAHNRIQTEEKSFICSICGKRYPQEKSLKKHMIRHSEEKRFSCSVCKKSFPWRGELIAHMRIHAGEKPFSCSVCGTRFTHSSAWTAHIRGHKGEKPFTCSVCKSSFSRRADLVVHMRTHTGEKPFSCSVCGKRFARKHQKQHMRIHTGEKPFSCSVCGKRFAHNVTLMRHLTVHTGEKRFICSVCGKRFAHNVSLKRHSTVHTGEKPFSCGICNKRFTRLQYVKKHKCVETAQIFEAAETRVEN
uniref:gastrula zinc finger protein XlCGF57.1-like isoform X1 n=1 Tax=Semicossyphus pulcher TaxID=241346 RepID=UPI0037E749BA